jgi:hypothetical protein
MTDSSRVQGAVFLSVSSAIGTFTSLLPSIQDVRKASKNDADARTDVRLGEIASTALVIGIGIVASSVAESPIPAMAGILTALALVALYESILTMNPNTTLL